MAAGYLVPDGNRPQRKVSLPDNTRPRMYCVKGSILDDELGGESYVSLSLCSVSPVNLRAGRGLKAKADKTASVLVVHLLWSVIVIALNDGK
ncbi:hypothetical protein L1D21_12790 [Shewanella sp. Isolate11]|nr:hypothetical protein [Shewanella sp. Isolate11]MCG9697812.1 hypothetical protein [Shewanella sp. Isolate11]